MQSLRRRFARYTGIEFGTFRTPPSAEADYRLVFRLGFGAERLFSNFEAGIAGRNVYVLRRPRIEMVRVLDGLGAPARTQLRDRRTGRRVA